MSDYFIYFLVILFGLAASFSGLLTKAAALAGIAITILLFAAFRFFGIGMIATFFVLGSAVTVLRAHHNRRLKKEKGEKRKAPQVFANAGMAAGLSCLSLMIKDHSLMFALMVAAAFASATSDTISSELGMIYGKNAFNIIDFKKEEAGLDGVVTVEGLLFGIIGSAIIAILFCLFYGWNKYFFWILIAGFIGNLADSFLGAIFERKGKMNNDTVNFLNTVVGVIIILLFNSLPFL